MSDFELYRVTLPYATAGVIVRDGRIVEAAPILRWSIGKTLVWMRHWMDVKRGQIEQVPVPSGEPPGPSPSDSTTGE